MITNYIKPQLLIRQLLEVLPAVNEPSMNAFVYGPQYTTNRYTEAEERARMIGTEFVVRGENDPRLYVSYEGVTNPDNVELSGVRLFAEDMELSYALFDSAVGATETSPHAFRYNDVRRSNELCLVDDSGDEINLYDAARGGLASELDGRPVRIGDLVVVKEELISGVDNTYKRRVVDVKRSVEDSSLGALFCGPKNLDNSAATITKHGEAINGISSAGDINISVDQAGITTGDEFTKIGSKHAGLLQERFSIRFTKEAEDGTDGECKIRTASNNFESDDVAVTFSDPNTANVTVPGTGIAVAITVSKINAGDSFEFSVQTAYAAIDCVSGGGLDATITGEYLHSSDSTIVASCIEGDAAGQTSVWRISDTSGMEDVMEVSGAALNAGVGFGSSGTTLKFTKTQHVAGEEFGFPCIAKGETGEFSVLVLDGPVGDLSSVDEDELSNVYLTSVEIRGTFAGEITRRGLNAPREQWTAETGGIKIEADLALPGYGFGSNQDTVKLCKFTEEDAGTPLLFASYRELVPAAPGEKIIKVSAPSQLTQFGAKDLDNDLGFGASAALSGSQGKPIYVGRIESDDLAGYQEVLRKAENIDALYAHAPMSNDLDVQLAVRNHVDLMSNESNKRWRRAYISTNTPSDYRVVGGPSNIVSATITATEDGNVLVNDPDGSFISSNVQHGDLFRTNFTSDSWGDSSYDNKSAGGYVVHRVIDEESLLLTSGPSKPANVARRYEIWKKDNAENIADFIAARSSSFASRRVNNVFCDGGQYLTDDDEFVTIDAKYLAAEVAGLRTAVLAQQGLTNTEVALVASAPAMYVKYSQEQLNLVAANGSFIITQEYEDGPRFIRHQLTTKTDKGNMYYEDSVGVNIDEISFLVKYQLRPYIGRRNVNPETLADIFRDMYDILSEKTEDPGFGNSIGPSLIGFTDLVVRINDTFKDRIDVSAKLEVPLPLNVIDVTLNATASFNSGELALESLGITELQTLLNPNATTFDSDGNPVNPVYA